MAKPGIVIIGICTLISIESRCQDLDTPDNALLRTSAVVQTNIPGVPELFGRDGKPTAEGTFFTTEAYEKEAFKLVLSEANKAAAELQLPEKLPITENDVVQRIIVPYGFSQLRSTVGAIHTRDYGYFVSVGHKLSYVMGAHQDKNCREWSQNYQWATNRIDTNGAYQLATQWLAAVSMDVQGLNADCDVQVEPNSYWNAGLLARGVFTPIYDVSWLSPRNRTDGFGDVASVSLFAPTKTLIRLNVMESKYILRKPLQFTNMQELLATPERN